MAADAQDRPLAPRRLLIVMAGRQYMKQRTFGEDEPRPRFDYGELARAMVRDGGWTVDMIDATAIEAAPSPAWRLAGRLLGTDAGLALRVLAARRRYDAVVTVGDHLAVWLAVGERLLGGRRTHLTTFIGAANAKKRLLHAVTGFAQALGLVLVHTEAERRAVTATFGLPDDRVALVPLQVDQEWYRPSPRPPLRPTIGAAGVEFRDYGTLVEAAAGLPDMRFLINPQSPWSRKDPGVSAGNLPPNVELRQLEVDGIRDFYDELSAIAVPLHENDTAAGLTAVLQGMAMGKPVICTRTSGRASVITDGVNGLLVDPGDVGGWRRALSALAADSAFAARLGAEGRRWIEQHASMEHWVAQMRGHIEALEPRARRVPSGRSPFADEAVPPPLPTGRSAFGSGGPQATARSRLD
jgi:glycosyltransferase involved in cell wall biosynthesis